MACPTIYVMIYFAEDTLNVFCARFVLVVSDRNLSRNDSYTSRSVDGCCMCRRSVCTFYTLLNEQGYTWHTT